MFSVAVALTVAGALAGGMGCGSAVCAAAGNAHIDPIENVATTHALPRIFTNLRATSVLGKLDYAFVRHGGLAFSLVAFAVACGESSSLGTRSKEGPDAGSGGKTWTAGAFVGAENDDAGVPIANGSAVACETEPARLLRPGCPVAVPWASDCADEGLRCLYAGSSAGCFVEWECLLGFWSPLGEPCRDEESAPDPANDGACTPFVPVDGEPCNATAITCQYAPCGIGSYHAVGVTCACNRSVVSDKGCPTVP